jgi:hypothetical protein
MLSSDDDAIDSRNWLLRLKLREENFIFCSSRARRNNQFPFISFDFHSLQVARVALVAISPLDETFEAFFLCLLMSSSNDSLCRTARLLLFFRNSTRLDLIFITKRLFFHFFPFLSEADDSLIIGLVARVLSFHNSH